MAGPLRRDMRRCRSRQPRQTLPQPRRRPAADHERHSIGRRLGQFRGRSGRAPTARPACRSNVRRLRVSRPSSVRLRPTHCRTAISPQRCCSAACRPGRTFLSRALRRHQRERHRRRDAGRALPHRAHGAKLGVVRLVGRYDGAGLGHRRKPRRDADLPHHARQPSGLLHPFRRSHLCRLPGGAGTEAARWRGLAKHRHRGEVRRRPQPRRVPRQLQIQLARPELSRLPCRRPPVRAMGRSRGHQRLGADRHRRRDRLCRGRQLASGGAGAPRVP